MTRGRERGVHFSDQSEYLLINQPELKPRSTPTNFYGNSRESSNVRKRPADFTTRALNQPLNEFSRFVLGAGAVEAIHILTRCVSTRRGVSITQKSSKPISNRRTRSKPRIPPKDLDADAKKVEHILREHPSIHRTLQGNGCPLNTDSKKLHQLVRIFKKYV